MHEEKISINYVYMHIVNINTKTTTQMNYLNDCMTSAKITKVYNKRI